ncbi:MAG: ArgE/DapE family deacylase [Deferribacteres bacterium]|nr:ArgE/DapE family deacylase [Deferribacteres bacterium]
MSDFKVKIDQTVADMRSAYFAFLQKLVQTPSLPGQEQAVQNIISSKLRSLGLAVDVIESKQEELLQHPAYSDDGIPFEQRLNVIGCWRGNGKKTSALSRTLILNGHVDVVSPGNEDLWQDSPWSGIIENGRLFGRGSCDMKSGLASAIFAVEALQRLGLQPAKDVLIESVIGEESGGIGTLTLIQKGYKADAAIILEPTNLMLCPVQSGALTFRLKIQGKAAHAALKKSGINAIEKLLPLMQAIDVLEKARHKRYQSELFDDPQCIAPISIGTINGGNWHSSVPEYLHIEGRFGVFPGESVDAAKEEFSQALMQAAKEDSWLSTHPPVIEWFEGQFESGQTEIDAKIVKALQKAHQKIWSTSADIKGVTYGSDLRLFTNHAGMPAVLYGPGDVRQAHAVDECIELEHVLACTKTLALLISHWCGCSED